jgi:hypothetical protein
MEAEGFGKYLEPFIKAGIYKPPQKTTQARKEGK